MVPRLPPRPRRPNSWAGRVPLLAAALHTVAGIAGLGCHSAQEENRAASAARALAPGASAAIPAPDVDIAAAALDAWAPARATAEVAPAADPNPVSSAAMSSHTSSDAARTNAASDSQIESAPDPANKSRPPLTSPDLQERAAHLLDAVARDEPALGDDFFFPKAPFLPLKDVADPGRYFDQLLATYHRDIRALRAERKDWTGAEFVSFELGTPPTWVAPGKEYNKIGYFRTFGGKLRYRVGDKVKELGVSTIISWDGRWYVTHLSPIRH